MSNAQAVKLKVIEGPLLGTEWDLSGLNLVRLGRRESCEIWLDDPAVSGFHCQITFSGGAHLLKDLGSSNGTMLNGDMVGEQALRHRDLFVVGDCVLQFLSADPSGGFADTNAALVADNWTQQASDIVEKFPADMSVPQIQGQLREADVRRLQSALQACYQLAGFINDVDVLEQHFHRLLSIISQAYRADRACLVLRIEDSDAYEVVCTVEHQAAVQSPFEVSRTILDSCVTHGNSILTLGEAATAMFDASESLQSQQVQAILCVPIGNQTTRFGALYLDSVTRVGAFDRQDLLLLTCLASLIGGAIDRSRLGNEAVVSQRQLETINEAMTAFIDREPLSVVSQILLDRCLAQTGSSAGFVAIIRGEQELHCQAQHDFFREVYDCPWPMHFPGSIIKNVIASSEAFLANGLSDKTAPETLPRDASELTSLLAVPVMGATQPIGLIVLANRADGYAPADRDSLEVLAGMAGVIYQSHERQLREKALAEQFRHSQKMEAVGRLAGGVAHDFNNMLTVINGYCDLLLTKLGPGAPLELELKEIHKCGQRSVELTRQLLSLSRKQVLQPRVLDLNGVLGEMETMLRRLIGEDIGLEVLKGANIYPVFADVGQLQQVLMNLSVNARDAMLQGGKLTIETTNVQLGDGFAEARTALQPGPHVRLIVKDTGCGMNPETQARIFEPFYTTKATGEGTGLGLSTVHGIIEQFGGHIDVDTRVGRGTTFEIYLPKTEQEEAPQQPKEFVLSEHADETILLVEDEDAVRKLAQRVLSGHGYTVLEASGSGEALLIAEREGESIHLMLADVIMPHMSGPQLAERLQPMCPQMKLLFMSAYPDAEVERKGGLDPETPFLQKPFEPNGLLHRVRETLGRRRG